MVSDSVVLTVKKLGNDLVAVDVEYNEEESYEMEQEMLPEKEEPGEIDNENEETMEDAYEYKIPSDTTTDEEPDKGY